MYKEILVNFHFICKSVKLYFQNYICIFIEIFIYLLIITSLKQKNHTVFLNN